MLDISKFEVGKPVMHYLEYPTFFGMQRMQTPVYIYRASEKISPCVVVTSCVHGDETNGMRISQALIRKKLKLKRGTLIVFPIINLYGFMNQTRALPDGRDLNRCFPGYSKGSFGRRFAKFIFDEITRYGDVFVDLHSGTTGRFNIPQIRCDIGQEVTGKLLDSIRVPLVVNSDLRDGSLREAINNLQKPCLVFEGGEGLRVDEKITHYGIELIKSVLTSLKMLPVYNSLKKSDKVYIYKTKWIRARRGGLLLNKVIPGKIYQKGETIGEVRQITGELVSKIQVDGNAVVLGFSRNSMVMAGDALFNIGYLGETFQDDSEFIYE